MKILEGGVFVVPLKHGASAIGVAARIKPGRGAKCILGYFFKNVFSAQPNVDDVGSLRADDAILIAVFGDLGIKTGNWPIIGVLPSWDRNAWPVPAFVRKDVVSGRVQKIVYADEDPSKVVSEVLSNEGEVKHLPRDGLWGAGAIEAYLSHVLNSTIEQRSSEL